jgi:quercetin dioxygenase-like cupin family protein
MCSVIAALALLPLLSLRAQEATPPASGTFAAVELAPGLTAEVFTGVPTALAEGQTLYTIRFTFQPGSEIPAHSHPGTVSLTVTEGTLGWTLLEGTATVIRASASGEPTGTEEVTEAGVEVMLEPGDAIYYEDDVVHTARGASDETTIVYGSLLLETGQSIRMPVDMDMATPAD